MDDAFLCVWAQKRRSKETSAPARHTMMIKERHTEKCVASLRKCG